MIMTTGSVQTPSSPKYRCWHDACLRAFDIGLALTLGLLTTPLMLMIMPGARLRKSRLVGRHEERFESCEIEFKPGIRQRLGSYMGLCRTPVLVNILFGQMSWVGPRALTLGELPPESMRGLRSSVRPGVFSLWTLRQRTCIDYGDEWSTDCEQIAQRSLPGELGILMRNVFVSAYGNKAESADRTPTMFDTVWVNTISMNETLNAIDSRRAATDAMPLQICFVNPDCVNIARRNSAYRHALNQADLAVPDGIGMRIAARILRKGFRQNVNGTDLFPRLCERLAADGGRLYLLGGRPGVAERVADWVGRHHSGVQIAGTHHGYFNPESQETLIEQIRASEPDVLLVAMGAPRQDLWIQAYGQRTGAKVAMGVGGLFDFYADRIPRAPQWLREIGLEWAFRLYQEPRRMWRRYLVGNIRFLVAISLQRWLGSIDLTQLRQESTSVTAPAGVRRAVVIATQSLGCEDLLRADINSVMLPLGDRTLLYRHIETLAELGCREVDLFASHGLETIRELVGAGERWGVKANIHAVRDFSDARKRIVSMKLATDESLWLVCADRWLPATAVERSQPDTAWFYLDEDGHAQWTGWARIGEHTRADFLSALEATGLQAGELPASMSSIGTTKPFGFDSGKVLLEAQSRWLNRVADRFDLSQETSPGIRVAAGAYIAPGATLIAPLEVGENASISANATVGPNVVIGEGCRIAGDTSISNALIAEGVSIKGPVEIDEAIVTAAGLFNTAHVVWVPIDATGDILTTGNTMALPRITLLERLTAVLALVFCLLPVLALRALGRNGDFSQRIYPQLIDVIRGQKALIGIAHQLDMPETIQASGWSLALQRAPKGLIRPCDALAIDDPDAAAWADVHWLLHAGWKERFRLLRAYFSRSSCHFTVQ